MTYLNPQIEKKAKYKKKSLYRKQLSCGIFQDLAPNKAIKEQKKHSD